MLILERTIIFAVATVIYICCYFVLEIKKSSHNDKYPIPTSLRNKIILTIIEPKLRQACMGAAGQKAWTWPGRSNCSPKGQLYPLPFRTRVLMLRNAAPWWFFTGVHSNHRFIVGHTVSLWRWASPQHKSTILWRTFLQSDGGFEWHKIQLLLEARAVNLEK